MRCPSCKYEPRDRLLHQPCPECGHVWWDTENYVFELSKGLDVKTVLDIGCGKKGIIGQHHWENVVGIERGYACDIHVVKDLPSLWTPLVMDAVGLVDRLGEKSAPCRAAGPLPQTAFTAAPGGRRPPGR